MTTRVRSREPTGRVGLDGARLADRGAAMTTPLTAIHPPVRTPVGLLLDAEDDRVPLEDRVLEDQRGRAAKLAADELLGSIRVAYNELRRLAEIERARRPLAPSQAISVRPSETTTRRYVDVERLRQLVGEGLTDAAIGQAMGYPRSTISAARKRLGIERAVSQTDHMHAWRAAHPDVDAIARREQIRTLLASGVSGAAVARRLGVSPALVCITRRALGLPPPDLAISRVRSVQASANARRGKHRRPTISTSPAPAAHGDLVSQASECAA